MAKAPIEKQELPAINQRVMEIIKLLGYRSQNAFADALGTSSGRMSNISTGRNKPDIEFIQQICAVHTNVSSEWLLLGTGTPIKEEGHLSPKNQGHLSPSKKGKSYIKKVTPEILVATQDTTGNPTIPLINYKAAANYISGYETEEYYEELDALSLPKSLIRRGPQRQYFGFQVVGDSMMPRLRDLDWVLAGLMDRSEWQDMKDNQVYVVVSKFRGISIKRCLNRLTDWGHIVCKSDNRYHHDFSINEDDLLQMFRVELMISNNIDEDMENLQHRVDMIEEVVMELKRKFL